MTDHLNPDDAVPMPRGTPAWPFVIAGLMGCGMCGILAMVLGGAMFASRAVLTPVPPPAPAVTPAQADVSRLSLVPRGGGAGELEVAASVLRQRLAGMQIEGQVWVEDGRLQVEVPDAAFRDALALLTAGGRLQFKLVATLAEEAAAAEVARIDSQKSARGYEEAAEPLDTATREEGPLLLENPGVEGYLLARVYPTTDEHERPAIGFEFGPEGRAAFRALTGEHVGRELAVVLDGRVQMVATIASAIDGSGVISREEGYGEDELQRLITLLSSGRLPVELDLEGQD